MLDRTEYENYWYAFQQKLDKLLDERDMTYRGLSIELGKSPGYMHKEPMPKHWKNDQKSTKDC